jgi:hypothetical protein
MIDLSNYDEITAYLSSGNIIIANPKKIAWIVFIVMVFNLFLVCVSLMKTIMFPNQQDSIGYK